MKKVKWIIVVVLLNLFLPNYSFASGEVLICNTGKHQLTFGTIRQTNQNLFSIATGKTLNKGGCTRSTGKFGTETFFFLIIDKNDGQVYNPTYKLSGAGVKLYDQLIKRVCIPKKLSYSNKVSGKVMNKFQTKCPRNWVHISNSFGVISAGDNRTTLNINSSLSPLPRRVW